MLGVIGYFIGKEIYLWYRKKRGIATEPNLGLILFITFLFTDFPFLMLILLIVI